MEVLDDLFVKKQKVKLKAWDVFDGRDQHNTFNSGQIAFEYHQKEKNK